MLSLDDVLSAGELSSCWDTLLELPNLCFTFGALQPQQLSRHCRFWCYHNELLNDGVEIGCSAAARVGRGCCEHLPSCNDCLEFLGPARKMFAQS